SCLFHAPPPTALATLSLHDALPISPRDRRDVPRFPRDRPLGAGRGRTLPRGEEALARHHDAGPEGALSRDPVGPSAVSASVGGGGGGSHGVSASPPSGEPPSSVGAESSPVV